MTHPNPITCSQCGCTFDEDTLTAIDDVLLCPDCMDELTILCADCGERILRSENAGTDSHPLCSVCRDDNYTYCTCCERLIHNNNAYYRGDEDDPYCHRCYEELSNQAIHPYSYKPTPLFYGDGERYFGVELEIDGGGEDDDNATTILNIGNARYNHIYCKHDGSLEEGFEIVTHPMTLEYHLHKMPWSDILQAAREMGYTSHQAETCGLHVHVSRSALGDTYAEQDNVIARILYFVERHWNELLRFSRRTSRQLQRWAARYGYKDEPKEMLSHAKSCHAGRYTCINLTNDYTIEFRIFRGTLKLNTLIATLQMVNHICDVAIALSDEEMRALSWSDFADRITEDELIRYLKERRLYLNDPIESEVEV